MIRLSERFLAALSCLRSPENLIEQVTVEQYTLTELGLDFRCDCAAHREVFSVQLLGLSGMIARRNFNRW